MSVCNFGRLHYGKHVNYVLFSICDQSVLRAILMGNNKLYDSKDVFSSSVWSMVFTVCLHYILFELE